MAFENSNTAPLALLLGATGGIGGHVARKLAERGWRVRAMHRSGSPQNRSVEIHEWVTGDAMSAADLLAAAQGASIIVHAVNPPGYRNWAGLAVPMLENTVAAAKATGAGIVFPGTVYNYGPDAFPLIDESSPQNPETVKGRIRVDMERRLRAAADGGVQVIVVRAGDFFGAGAGNSWFKQVVVTPGRALKSVTMPGAPGIGHQWAYLPDLAETMVQLVERSDELPPFAVFNMDGFNDPDGTQMVAAIQRVAGRDLKQKRFPWLLLRLASPFVPLFRELIEMRYLWETPVRLDNAKLVAFLGKEPHTPLDEALSATLMDYGCLPAHNVKTPG